jgi:hypothetical protein
MSVNLDRFFLFEPFKTDELRAELTGLRNELDAMNVEQQELAGALEKVAGDLALMEAKVRFVDELLAQTFEVFVPPDPEAVEIAYERETEGLYRYSELAQLYVGAAGLGAWALGGAIGPGLAKTIGFVARSQKIAGLAGSSRFLKLARAGKGTVALAAAVAIVEVAIRLKDARKINDHLIEKRAEIEARIEEAEEVLAAHRFAIGEATHRRDTLLAEAGVPGDLSAYLQRLNDAIADIGRRKSFTRMARRMLRRGMARDEIAALMPDMPAEAIAGIERRLSAETMLVEGETVEGMGRHLGLTAFERRAVARVLDARDAALAEGLAAPALAARFAVAEAVAEFQIDLLAAALPGLWSAIDGEGSAEPIARALLVRPGAVARLRLELSAKAALARGEAPEAVAAARPGLEAATLAAWAEAMPSAREKAKELLGGPGGEAAAVAASLRLPLAALPGPVEAGP